MPVRLTETAIAKAVREAPSSGRRDLADAGCPGLRLRVTPAGRATWALACRDRLGRMRRFTLGAYPERGISEARSEARKLHAAVRSDGADPTAERRRERAMGEAARAGVGTLSALLNTYAEKRGNTQKAWADSRRRIEKVFKPLLTRPIGTLTAADFQLTADAYAFPVSAAFAVRTVRPVLKWAAQPGRAYVAEGITRLHPPTAPKRRDRVLSREELGLLLPVLRASSRPYAKAMLFMLLTLARREEVTQARWRDVNLDAGTWAIPETKNGQPHVVPLSRQAADLLRARQPAKPLSAGLVFATRSGAALGNWDRETKALQAASGTDGWTRHDLRRTGATMLGEMGEMPDIIEAALNHVSIRSQIAATYNRSRYRPQVAAALQRLADALDGIEQGAGEVLPLHRKTDDGRVTAVSGRTAR